MGNLHGLILIPYYFFGALTVLAVSMVVCRVLRMNAPINSLVGAAIGLALVLIIVPLACDWVDVAQFTGRPMLALGLVSFVLAAADTALAGRLPLPLDDELRDL